jgi:hypothetical protein
MSAGSLPSVTVGIKPLLRGQDRRDHAAGRIDLFRRWVGAGSPA